MADHIKRKFLCQILLSRLSHNSLHISRVCDSLLVPVYFFYKESFGTAMLITILKECFSQWVFTPQSLNHCLTFPTLFASLIMKKKKNEKNLKEVSLKLLEWFWCLISAQSYVFQWIINKFHINSFLLN